MADPVVISCPSSCTVQVEFVAPLLNLTIEEGGQIAGAILAVWAVAWGVRILAQTIRSGSSSTNESES